VNVFELFATIGLDTSEYEKGMEKVKKSNAEYKSDVMKLAQTYQKQQGISKSDALKKAYADIDKSQYETAENAEKNAARFSASWEKAADNIVNVAGKIKKGLATGFQAVESVGEKAGSAAMSALKGFAAASTAVAGFGAASVKSGMSFDATMSEVSAISGATGEEFDALRDKALEMGAKTKFSASEAGEAMTYMAMAGWKAEDMIGGIEGIMSLAAASGEDLATTSDIVTDALTAFGKSADESSRLADIMAAASSNANTNVSMLGESFKYVAPVAGALGYSMEDTSLALGLMANSGIKASQAGTSLRTAMTNMASPTKNMAAVMDEYGISLTNTDGSMMSLQDVMVQLREKMGGLDEATQASAASTLFGKEAMSGMLAIINAAPEDFEKLSGAIYDCKGAAEEMSATMIDNLQGDLTLLGSAFESLQIAISDGLTPTLRDFAKFGSKAMQNLLEGFQNGGVSGFMEALSGVFTDGITLLAEKAPEFANVSMQFMQSLATGILDARFEILEAGNNILITLSEGISSWLSSHVTEMQEFGIGIIRLIFQGFLSAGEIISENIGQFIPLIVNAFLSYHEALFTVGMDILGAIGKGLVESKDEIQEMASDTISNMVDSLIENAPAIIDGAIALLEAMIGAITENTDKFSDAAISIVEKLIDVIIENLPLFAESALQIITTLAEKLAESSPELIPSIVEIILEIVDILTDPDNLSVLLDAALQIIIALAEGIAAALPELLAKVPEIMINLGVAFIEAIPELLKSLVEVGVAIVKGIWEGIQSAAGEFWEDVKGFFGDIVGGVKDFLGIHSPSRVFAGIGENMALGLGEGWDNEFSRIKGQIEGGMDFGTASVGLEAKGRYDGKKPAFNMMRDTSGTNEKDITINLTAELDGMVLARKMVRYNERAKELVGPSLVKR